MLDDNLHGGPVGVKVKMKTITAGELCDSWQYVAPLDRVKVQMIILLRFKIVDDWSV